MFSLHLIHIHFSCIFCQNQRRVIAHDTLITLQRALAITNEIRDFSLPSLVTAGATTNSAAASS